MIDFHSHILPNMDDGSESVEQSLDMLRVCAGQNIDTIAATPHFCREKESVNSFLHRRETLFLQIKLSAEKENLPNILLGSETAFFDGISCNDEIDELCIEKSRCL